MYFIYKLCLLFFYCWNTDNVFKRIHISQTIKKRKLVLWKLSRPALYANLYFPINVKFYPSTFWKFIYTLNSISVPSIIIEQTHNWILGCSIITEATNVTRGNRIYVYLLQIDSIYIILLQCWRGYPKLQLGSPTDT